MLLEAHLESRRFISDEAHNVARGGIPHQATVEPNDVRSLIEYAMESGWGFGCSTYCVPPGIHLGDYTTRTPT